MLGTTGAGAHSSRRARRLASTISILSIASTGPPRASAGGTSGRGPRPGRRCGHRIDATPTRHPDVEGGRLGAEAGVGAHAGAAHA